MFLALSFLVQSCSSPAPVHRAIRSARTTATTQPLVVAVTTADNPSLGTILTDSNGMTLYHYAPERDGEVECLGGCAQTWPPLTVPQGARLQAGPGVTGKLSVTRRPDGSEQVTYNGWPLYLFSKDTVPGDAGGEGMGGLWTAVQVPASGTTSVPLHPLT